MPIVLDGTGSITGLTAGAGVAASALSGQVPDVNAPSGSVIQVVHTSFNTGFSSTATGFFDSPIPPITIIPTSASSKFLVLLDIKGGGQSATTHIQFKLQRNNSDVYVGTNPGSQNPASGWLAVLPAGDVLFQGMATFLDSPASASAITYKCQVRNNNSNGTIYLGRSQDDVNSAGFSRAPCSLTVMEISA